jgi:NADPH:quinone reductase-like Zn-dependent oxidoreductase
MRAILYETLGPPSVLKLVNVPIPKPKEGEVLVKNYAAGCSTFIWKAMMPHVSMDKHLSRHEELCKKG